MSCEIALISHPARVSHPRFVREHVPPPRSHPIGFRGLVYLSSVETGISSVSLALPTPPHPPTPGQYAFSIPRIPPAFSSPPNSCSTPISLQNRYVQMVDFLLLLRYSGTHPCRRPSRLGRDLLARANAVGVLAPPLLQSHLSFA